jgi:AraC-like DNA-binding protein
MPVILGANDIKQTPYISSSFTPPRHSHGHEFFELSFCVSGFSVNTINGVQIPFQNGMCVILRPGDVHSLTEYDKNVYEHVDLYATTENFRAICDSCHKDLYNEILRHNTPLHFSLSGEMFSFLFNQSLYLKEMIANGNKYFQIMYTSMMSVIVSEWIKHEIYQQTYKPTWLKELLPKFNSINFVQKNITMIAQEVGFSLPYFSSQFKKYMGMSAIEYLIKKRVHLSKDLLANDPRLRILDISGMLGFENPSTFSKHFMAEFKLSPKEYRKQAQRPLE